jgi:hypothetical protein
MVDVWHAWSPQRFFYLFIGMAYLLIWIQVGLFHWRGAFRHTIMWGPVLYAPILAIMGMLYAFVYGGWLNWLFVIIFSLGALEGLIGTYYHLAGVKHYIGGWTLRNLMNGPPFILPITFLAFSAVALLIFFLWPGPVGGL